MKLKKILILIFIIILLITTVIYVKADSGWDTDYGSSSDWGSSSSDWGGYSDWGYDSDYPSSSSTRSHHYSSSNDNNGFIIYVIFISTFLLWYYLFLVIGTKNRKSNSKKYTPSYPDVSDIIYKKYFNISMDELKKQIYNNFVDLQESWMNFDYDKLRNLCTDELYNQYKVLLETLKLKNEQNIMNDFKLNKISIYQINDIKGIVEVKVCLDVTFKDYVINSLDNKVTRGDKDIFVNNKYILSYIKGKNEKKSECPNCGADVDIVSSGVCEYCKSTIVNTSEQLVLSTKKIVSSRKFID